MAASVALVLVETAVEVSVFADDACALRRSVRIFAEAIWLWRDEGEFCRLRLFFV